MSGEASGRGNLRYPDYLRLAELLSLQQPVSRPAHHDETLFIIVHQVFELWFKLVLHDLDAAGGALDRDDPRGALPLTRRAGVTIRKLIEQVDVLASMSALDFLEFRSGLEGASGFQSAQFRELEAVLGLREADRVPVGLAAGPSGTDAYRGLLAPEERERVERRLAEPSLEQRFLGHVARAVQSASDGRAYLGDVSDLLAERGASAASVLAAIEPEAEVWDETELTPALERLARLPLWSRLGEGERTAVIAAARRARLLETARKVAHPLSGDECYDLRMLDEELERRRSVALARIDDALARAGLTAEDRRQLAATLDVRQRLRQVYRRARHARDAGDAWDTYQAGEALVELGESVHLFRFRHVKMVERMIGRRRGTGGSPGVAYLEQTVRYRSFPELMRVRTWL